MVRLAAQTDAAWLTQQMLELKAHTAWAQVEDDYTDDTVSQFITERLSSAESVCYVWDDGERGLAAFCGATLGRFYLPPYVPNMFEWGWGGSQREAIHCWHACVEWGRKHGARWCGRVSSKPGQYDDYVVENMIWEKL